MNKPLIIIGNGGHASVLIEILLTNNETIIGYVAPSEETNRFGIKYLGTDDVLKTISSSEVELVLGLGMLGPKSIREKLYQQLKLEGHTFKSVIHPSAIIAPSATLGEGIQVMAGVIIQTAVKIADNTIVNTGVIVDHDCCVGSHVHLGPGTTISGSVNIDNGAHIGTGSKIIQGVNIGESCMIGAGSVVVKNILPYTKAYGVPAKEVN